MIAGEGRASERFLGGRVILNGGDNRDVLRGFPDNSIDSVVTDPPYALVSIAKRFGKDGAAPVIVPEGGSGAYARASRGFMGKEWDTGETAFAVEFWQQVYRVLKPGGHVVAFSGTRTYHRMAVAIEDAGFEIRDCLQWLYGSGFPKSHNVSKGIDRAAGAIRGRSPTIFMAGSTEVGAISKNLRCAICGKPRASGDPCKCPRIEDEPITRDASQWDGWGTALKPAVEPICLARKPLIGTVAENVLTHGTGALNIDGTRIGTRIGTRTESTGEVIGSNTAMAGPNYGRVETGEQTIGRWPANILHDGSDEVVSGFPETGLSSGGSGEATLQGAGPHFQSYGGSPRGRNLGANAGGLGDSGSAARFFYTAKADAIDRAGSRHPTVKPVDLMQWLCRLVTPPGGTILDPFAGSGTTGEAAWREGFNCILIEREAEYLTDIRRRLTMADQGPLAREHSRIVALGRVDGYDSMPLFGGG